MASATMSVKITVPLWARIALRIYVRGACCAACVAFALGVLPPDAVENIESGAVAFLQRSMRFRVVGTKPCD